MPLKVNGSVVNTTTATGTNGDDLFQGRPGSDLDGRTLNGLLGTDTVQIEEGAGNPTIVDLSTTTFSSIERLIGRNNDGGQAVGDDFKLTASQFDQLQFIDGQGGPNTIEIVGGGTADARDMTVANIATITTTGAATTLKFTTAAQAAIITAMNGTNDRIELDTISANAIYSSDILFQLYDVGAETIFINSTRGGTVEATVNENGAGTADDIMEMTFVDTGNVKEYATEYKEIDRNGVIRFNESVMDDTSTRTTTYDATGAITSLSILDGAANLWTYESLTNNYVNGVIDSSILTLDNGVKGTTTYVGGVKTQLVQEDLQDANTWTTITSTFHANGRVDTRTTLNDNGEVWNEIVLDYDQTGSIESQFYSALNGTTRLNTFSNGQLALSETSTTVDGQGQQLPGDPNLTLIGYAGSQTLVAGGGNDVLRGGADSDTFVFPGPATNGFSGVGSDTVSDFTNGVDLLDLTAWNVDSVADLDLVASIAQVGTATVITFDGGFGTIRLSNFSMANLDDSDFVV